MAANSQVVTFKGQDQLSKNIKEILKVNESSNITLYEIKMAIKRINPVRSDDHLCRTAIDILYKITSDSSKLDKIIKLLKDIKKSASELTDIKKSVKNIEEELKKKPKGKSSCPDLKEIVDALNDIKESAAHLGAIKETVDEIKKLLDEDPVDIIFKWLDRLNTLASLFSFVLELIKYFKKEPDDLPGLIEELLKQKKFKFDYNRTFKVFVTNWPEQIVSPSSPHNPDNGPSGDGSPKNTDIPGKIIDSVESVLNTLINAYFGSTIDAVLEICKMYGSEILDAAKTIVSDLTSTIQSVTETVFGAVDSIVGNVTGTVQSVVGDVTDTVQSGFGSIQSIIETPFQTIQSVSENVSGTVQSGFGTAKSIVDSIAGSTQSVFETGINAVKSVLETAIINSNDKNGMQFSSDPASSMLQGNAEINIQVSVQDDRVTTNSTIMENTLPIRLNIGSRYVAREVSL